MRGAAILVLLIRALAAQFDDVSARSGIGFQHDSSATSRKYLIEAVSGGVAMFDFDGDGWLDLYFVNGAKLGDPMNAGAAPDKSHPRYWNRLYRNRRDGTFEDVTERAGVRGQGYGMGAAAADYDNDGDADLYVTAFGRNTLYRNRGNGTFEDATVRAGLAGDGWSSSAAWVDVDHDGALDLVVARYVTWDFEPDLWCGARKPGYRSYCHPDQFPPISHRVYRNRGDGTFDDISKRSGFAAAPGKGLGVAIRDFDRDGRIDIAVANDSYPQQLFRNLGNGRFQEIGLDAGMAYDGDGVPYAGMGIDFGDYDNDGWPDLFINALATQRYALYRNRAGRFEYASPETGVAAITRLRSGWGARFIDYDNDGWLDLFVAQGHVMDNIERTQPALRYREPMLLMRNLGGRFAEISAFQTALASRGAAFGDLDNDGQVDVAVNVNNGRAVVLRNRATGENHWLTLETVGRRSNRDGIGAQVRVAGQHAIVSTAGSYLSSNDKRVHFGLGKSRRVDLVEIIWPSGVSQKIEGVDVDQILRVEEPLPPRP
ncbi:MAG: CRTAC1 family protein [Bryobacteraceae bacterium]